MSGFRILGLPSLTHSMGFDTESSEVVTFTIMHGDGCKLYNHLRAWIQATSLVSKFESKARMAHLVRTPVFCEISSKNCSNQQSASPETTKTVLQLDHVLRGREVSPHDTASLGHGNCPESKV